MSPAIARISLITVPSFIFFISLPLAYGQQPTLAPRGPASGSSSSSEEVLPTPPAYSQTGTTKGTVSVLESAQSILEPSPASQATQKPQADIPAKPVPPPTDDSRAPATTPAATAYELAGRGPVHEAFATVPTVSVDSPVIATAPPPLLDEKEARVRPAGKNINWIGGYWAYDSGLGEYLWVSGVHRDTPPGRQWFEGYWTEVEGGHQWTRGYWGSQTHDPTALLPSPPSKISDGPTKTAPNSSSFWLAGHWAPSKSTDGAAFQWQDGFWTKQQSKWVWQPASLVKTPQGNLFVTGYWDYEPTFRGTQYAPLMVNQELASQGGIRFRPEVPFFESKAFLLHAFVRPGDHHYYHGDYYADQQFTHWHQASPSNFPTGDLTSYYVWKYRQQGIEFASTMAYIEDYFRTAPNLLPAAGVGLDEIVRATAASPTDQRIAQAMQNARTPSTPLARNTPQTTGQASATQRPNQNSVQRAPSGYASNSQTASNQGTAGSSRRSRIRSMMQQAAPPVQPGVTIRPAGPFGPSITFPSGMRPPIPPFARPGMGPPPGFPFPGFRRR